MEKKISVHRVGDCLSSGFRRPAELICAPKQRLDSQYVIGRLEAAGAALLALPHRGYSTKMRQMRFDVVHSVLDAYGWGDETVRAPAPDAAAISGMDEAFEWLTYIPEARYVLRRILGARALVHPLTARHIFPWRRLGSVLGADHKSVKKWHQEGIKFIQDRLNGGIVTD